MRIEPVTVQDFVVCQFDDCHQPAVVYVQLPNRFWVCCCREHISTAQQSEQGEASMRKDEIEAA